MSNTENPSQQDADSHLKERIAKAIQARVEQGNVHYEALADAVLAELHTGDKRYPRPDGDVTVLGPEVFASADGNTISWRGDNYTRQEVEPRVVVYGIDVSEWDRMWGVVRRIERAIAPDPAAGPTVREAAAQDRRWWNGEKTGDQP
ncbi:hypothetical protein AB0D42_27850 [Streptomyces sp. NPDC048304]|uniref:hypothetical protein n=1 Tax=Streptomyces sp. NPDC048304 TaxID=3154820 RepID=UPI0033CF01ED